MDSRNFLLGCIAFAVAALSVVSAVGLGRINDINDQLKRQTIATEQSAKSAERLAVAAEAANVLLKEQNAVLPQMEELMRQLPTPLAQPGPSPKK